MLNSVNNSIVFILELCLFLFVNVRYFLIIMIVFVVIVIIGLRVCCFIRLDDRDWHCSCLHVCIVSLMLLFLIFLDYFLVRSEYFWKEVRHWVFFLRIYWRYVKGRWVIQLSLFVFLSRTLTCVVVLDSFIYSYEVFIVNFWVDFTVHWFWVF